MNVKEIIMENKGKYSAIEVWAYTDKTHRLHSDFIENVDEMYSLPEFENKEVIHFKALDEYDYNYTILANSSESADFESLYGDKNAKVLVLMLDENWNKN